MRVVAALGMILEKLSWGGHWDWRWLVTRENRDRGGWAEGKMGRRGLGRFVYLSRVPAWEHPALLTHKRNKG